MYTCSHFGKNLGMEEGIDIDADYGEVSDGAIDGDCGEDLLPRRHVRRARPIAEGPLGEGPLAICFLVASARKRSLGHGMHPEPHESAARLFTGPDALAGIALLRWVHHNSRDYRSVDPEAVPDCRIAQMAVLTPISGFVYYKVLALAMSTSWPRADHLSPALLRRAAQTVFWTSCDDVDSQVVQFDDLIDSLGMSHGLEEYPECSTFILADPSAALKLFDSRPGCLAAFALSSHRLPRQYRCLPLYPSVQNIRRLMAHAAHTGPIGQIASVRMTVSDLSADECLEFLEASASAKSLRDVPKAGCIWTRILQRRNPGSVVQLGMLPSYEVPRTQSHEFSTSNA